MFFFQSLLKTADQLKIKGLCEVPDSKDTGNDLQGQSSSNFKTQINLFGSEFQQPSQQIKTFSFDNVVQPVSLKSSFLPSELSLNQLPRIKQSNSPPIFTHDNFVPVKQNVFTTSSEKRSVAKRCVGG